MFILLSPPLRITRAFILQVFLACSRKHEIRGNWNLQNTTVFLVKMAELLMKSRLLQEVYLKMLEEITQICHKASFYILYVNLSL